jgi:hypothetical protein
MRQFDVVSLADGSLALILQAGLLVRFSCRVVAPLVPAKSFPQREGSICPCASRGALDLMFVGV